MPTKVNTTFGQEIILVDKPFQTGGEGELYKIISPSNLTNYCVKLYYSQYQNEQKERKLKHMMANKPQTLTDSSKFNICWVTDVVYRNNKFIGFLMPLAFTDSIQLYELCTLKIKKDIDVTWHKKFDRTNTDSLPNRLKLCVNIAIAIHHIHATQKYTLVDMKPQNILVTHDGKISIVDLDSIQISENNIVLHHSNVATPEYTPIEGGQLNPSLNLIPETWDRFSLAVIFYELIFGLHPFVATSISIYEHITTIEESIQKGLFAHGSKSKYLQLPPLHNNFNLLPKRLKEYFINALDNGNHTPSVRPRAKDWGEAIFLELNSDKNIKSQINSKPEVIYLEKIVHVERPVEKIIYKNDPLHSFIAIIASVVAFALFIVLLNMKSNCI